MELPEGEPSSLYEVFMYDWMRRGRSTWATDNQNASSPEIPPTLQNEEYPEGRLLVLGIGLGRGGQPNKFLHDLTPQISNDILGKVASRAVSRPKIYCDLFVTESPQKDRNRWNRLEYMENLLTQSYQGLAGNQTQFKGLEKTLNLDL